MLIGKAPTNRTSAQTTEGFVQYPYGFGDGDVVADNSGTLKYVRIEYAGNQFQPNKEL